VKTRPGRPREDVVDVVCAVVVAVARKNASTVVRKATLGVSAKMKLERLRRNPFLATTAAKRVIMLVIALPNRLKLPRRSITKPATPAERKATMPVTAPTSRASVLKRKSQAKPATTAARKDISNVIAPRAESKNRLVSKR